MADGSNATLNQKVFVTLRGYTALVDEYHRVLAVIEERRRTSGTSDGEQWIARRNALEFVFRTLELPVEKRRT